MNTLKRAILALAVLVTGVAVLGGTATATNTEHKVYVCKYVGTPGVDERLQTGDNPIYVDWHSLNLDGEPFVGETFQDAQGRSVVIQIGGEDPGRQACLYSEETTTTVAETTTTVAETTTTVAETTTTVAGATTTVAAPTTTAAAPTTTATRAPVTTVATSIATTALPHTGSSSGGIALIAGILAAMGAGAIALARRKPQTT